MHVTLNMAASLDGRVSGPQGQPVQLSSEADLDRVHELRAASDAILVGIGTVLADDPQLTVRRSHEPEGDPPLRVVVDSRGRTPGDARVLDDAAPTVIATSGACEATWLGAGTFRVGKQQVDLARLLDELADRGVERLLVEGGPTVAASALEAGLVDRFQLYVAPRVLGQGRSLPAALEGREIELGRTSCEQVGEGTVLTYEGPR